MANLLAFGDKIIGGGGGSSDVASKVKLKRDEWVNIPDYDSYTNYLENAYVNISQDITVVSGTSPIGGNVEYNVPAGWNTIVYTINDPTTLASMVGKTIEFGAVTYNATFENQNMYTLKYTVNGVDTVIHSSTTGQGSDNILFNNTGIAIPITIPEGISGIDMYYISATHSPVSVGGTLELGDVYAFDINEIPMPDIHDTKVEFNRYENRPLTFSRNTINLIKSDKKIVSTDNNGNQVEFGGSDGVLPHLVVISESGSTVTASKDGVTIELEETSTDHFECDLNMPNPQDVYGIWLIDALLNGQDAQVSLNVDTIKKYIVDDEHFHASITVTYPTGATVSCGKTGETPMYATESPYTFVVHSTGTYIITGERDGSTEVQTIHITANGQEKFVTLTVVPDGSTATPIDSVPVWLKCAGIEDKDYTEVSEVLADDDTLLAVLTNSNATDYLVRSTTFITDIVADETAMAYIGAYDYASDTLLGDSTWNIAIQNSAYFESVDNVKVPIMTSNTTPKGECFGTANGSSSAYYYAFDDNASMWGNVAPPNGVGYDFGSKKKIYRADVGAYYSGGIRIKNYKIQGCDDKTQNVWSDIYTGIAENKSASYTFSILIDAEYSCYRLYVIDTYLASNYATYIPNLQFYGRQNGGVQTWLHSAGIYDKHYTTLAEVLLDTSTLAALMASNDAVDYLVTAKSFIDDIVADEHAMKFIGANDYAADMLLADEEWLKAIHKSTYKSYVISVSVPTMTSATAPSGVVSASAQASGYEGYKAFDANDTTRWVVNSVTSGWLRYQFASAVSIGYFVLKPGAVVSAANVLKDYIIQGSNNGSDWNTLYEGVNTTLESEIAGIIENDAPYLYYQLSISSITTPGNNGFGVYTLQFYGRSTGGIQSWLHSAGIYNKLYTTVSEVASDVATMNALMSNHIAIAYLRSAKGLIEDITTNETAMKYIGAYDYASSELLSDADWCEGINSSGYLELVLNTKVPVMTSDNTPYGEILCSSTYSTYSEVRVFNGVNSTGADGLYWIPLGSDGANGYVGYEFLFPILAKKMFVNFAYAQSNTIPQQIYTLRGSNDGINFIDVGSVTAQQMAQNSYQNYNVTLSSNTDEYKYYRLYGIYHVASDWARGVGELQLYGRHTGAVQDWLHSANITDKTYATITELAHDKTTVMALMRNENALSYLVTAYGLINEICSNQTIMGAIGSFDHVTDVLLANEVWLVGISNSEFRELIYNVKVPTMTSNTTPKGTVAASSVFNTSYPAYMVFDGIDYTSSNNNRWVSATSNVNQYVQYDFGKSVTITCMYIENICGNGVPKDTKIQVSDDGTNWTDFYTFTNSIDPLRRTETFIEETHRYWRAFVSNIVNTSNNYVALTKLQFYGRETGAIQSWLNAAEIYDKNYTTLSELASDGTTLSALIYNHNASDYLVTAKGLIDGVCSNPTIMAYIGLNNYCADILLANEEWRKAIVNSAYVTSVCNIYVPTMTSATTPSGIVTSDSIYSNYMDWWAFSGIDSQQWISNHSTANGAISAEGWIGYEFTQAVKLCAVSIKTQTYALTQSYSVKYFDGNDWQVGASGNTLSANDSFTFALIHQSSKWRFYLTQKNTYGSTLPIPRIIELQFYGRVDV